MDPYSATQVHLSAVRNKRSIDFSRTRSSMQARSSANGSLGSHSEHCQLKTGRSSTIISTVCAWGFVDLSNHVRRGEFHFRSYNIPRLHPHEEHHSSFATNTDEWPEVEILSKSCVWDGRIKRFDVIPKEHESIVS